MSLHLEGLVRMRESFIVHSVYITSCVDGFIHVCDHVNDRVQIF